MANDQKEVSTPSGSTTDDGARRQPPRKAKKLYHKKSRTGCATCRSRRVKVWPPNRGIRMDQVGWDEIYSVVLILRNSVMRFIQYVGTVKDTEWSVSTTDSSLSQLVLAADGMITGLRIPRQINNRSRLQGGPQNIC